MTLPTSMPTALAQFRDPMHSVWLTEPASTFADKHDPLFMFIFWSCTVMFVGLMGLMGYFVIRYARRPGQAQQRSASHNTALEMTWTILPLFLLAVIFVWGFKGFVYMQVAPADSEQVRLTGSQWNWEMSYDNGAVSTMTTMVAAKEVPIFPVPAGKPTKVTMISRDVLHSFFVPDFRVKLDVLPNRYMTVWFEPTGEPQEQRDDAGELLGRWTDHYLFCTEYCGDGHSQMGAIIRVMPEADYLAWKQNAANPYEGLSPAEVGEVVYRVKGCNACHSVDGSSGTGPTWQGVYGSTEEFVGGGSTTVDDNYIRESVLEPAKNIVAGYSNQMPTYQGQLTEEELAGLIAYIKSLQ